MKKLFLVAAMTVMLGALGTVFATGETTTIEGDSGITKINYKVDPSYIITIPGEFTLSTDEIEKTVSASGALLADSHELNVKIKGNNCSGDQWYIKEATANNKYEYTLKKGDSKEAVANNSIILTVPAGNTGEVKTNLYFKLKDTVNKAGTYSDILTFTASVDPAEITSTQEPEVG